MGSARRLWKWVGAIGCLAFVVVVVLTGVGASTPTGVTPGGSMSMSMSTRGGSADIRVGLRDSGGRVHRLPGGRAGALLLMEPHGCPACVRAARSMAALRFRWGDRIDVHAVSLEPDITSAQIESFLRSARAPSLAVAIDTRLGDVAAMLDRPEYGLVLVYDRTGKVVARLASPTRGRLRTALSAAVRGRPS